MEVRVLVPYCGPRGNHRPGTVANLPEAEAKEWLRLGIAAMPHEKCKEEAPPGPVVPADPKERAKLGIAPDVQPTGAESAPNTLDAGHKPIPPRSAK